MALLGSTRVAVSCAGCAVAAGALAWLLVLLKVPELMAGMEAQRTEFGFGGQSGRGPRVCWALAHAP